MSIYDKKPWLKWYDQDVPPEIEIPDISYIDMLDRGINHNPDHPAFHFLGKTITFREQLSPYKIPKKIEFVDEMPLTNVGKLDKKALRKPK